MSWNMTTYKFNFGFGFLPVHGIFIDSFSTKLSFQPLQIGIPISELLNVVFRQFFQIFLKPWKVQFSVFIQIS